MYDVYATDRFMSQLRNLEKRIQKKADSEIESLKVNPQIGEKLKGLLSDCGELK